MDTFSALPAPIRLFIIKYLPDFNSLEALLHSSPVMASIFDECAAEVIEEIASHYFSPHVNHLLAQAGSIFAPNKTWNSVTDFHSCHAGSNSSNILPEGLPIPASRHLVISASNIDYLCRSFLRAYLDRIHALKPTHFRRPGTRMDPYAVTKYNPALAGPTYSISDTGPPSWVETQRVLRALWHLLIYYELRSIMPSLQSAPGDETKLQDLDYQDFWMHLPVWETDEMECVNKYMLEIADPNSLQLGTSAQLSRLPSAPPGSELESSWPTMTPQDDNIGSKWGQSQEATTRKSPASNMFPALCLRGPNIPSQILGGATWESFRRLGFGIWDLKRMCRLEMMSAPFDPQRDSTAPSLRETYTMDNLKFTWMSILPNK
ncbi:hypothetical protein BGW36DRAFT_370360 [Talaromyces proteolyticus]|uniref:F-box domain-containing protein n=1 Tax=Talaromyces proteolyticus TaxID=1131652 RepID=A0AAD4Q5H1_9EURO|nr:uncharacterized protein BGW36DRAFT_370360 [Talaromyces proteolyticus]KAH8704000.1 hypothetical protein BGW36DRAFT_370360 [Talaromyces proteolyticus]